MEFDISDLKKPKVAKKLAKLNKQMGWDTDKSHKEAYEELQANEAIKKKYDELAK
jgi:hypothetical protein